MNESVWLGTDEEMTTDVNVLMTSVSRKVWLVNAFKNALNQMGIEGNVISVDMDTLSAGLYVSDVHYIVPPPIFSSKFHT